jgi:hypothetical protein
MFPGFAPVIAGVKIIICAILLIGSAQAVPVSVRLDSDLVLSSDAQARSNPDEIPSAAPAEDVVTVPLPSAVVLFVSALAGLGLLARRRRAPKPKAAFVDLARPG